MIDIKYNEKEIKKQRPKNVRQVGEITGRKKIYIEDYVVTYLNQLAHPTNSVSRGAVLLGGWVSYEEEEILYICGAIETDNFSFDLEDVRFDNETWTTIYEKGSKYFEKVNIVGWFLSRLGYSTKLTPEMARVHNQYFRENNSVLLLMDALEQEETFYMKSNDTLVKQSGYYIYYERNTAMQNYLIDCQGGRNEQSKNQEIVAKDEQLLKHYHKIMDGRKSKKEEKKITNLLYVASAILTIAFLALGITIVNNYDKMKRMQQSLETLTSNVQSGEKNESLDQDNAQPENSQTETFGETSSGTDTTDSTDVSGITTAQDSPNSDASAVGQDNNTENAEETASGGQENVNNTSQADPGQASTQNTAGKNAEETTAAPAKSTEAVEASGTNVLNYYTVQQGDTLLSISEKIYHSDAYVNAIKQANEIGETDFIYPGQQIVLPKVD